LATAARRELIEETGYDARRFELLSQAPTSPGLTSETVAFFRAVGLKKVADGGGVDGEKIEVHSVKLTVAAAWLRKRLRLGVQIDCKTYAGLYFASCKAAPPLRNNLILPRGTWLGTGKTSGRSLPGNSCRLRRGLCIGPISRGTRCGTAIGS